MQTKLHQYSTTYTVVHSAKVSCLEMYFRPALADGRLAPLPWQVRSKVFNVVWPLKDNPTRWLQMVDAVFICTTLCSFLIEAEAALRFFIDNLSDIIVSTEAFATLVIYNDSMLRILDMALRKNSFKELLKEFYRDIYFDKEENHEMNKRVLRSIEAINVYSYFYLIAIITFCLGPVVTAILYNSRLLPHQLVLHYELDDPAVYGFTLALLTFNGIYATLVLTGGVYVLGNFIGHLCARYEILQNELEDSASSLTKVSASEVTQKFRVILNNGIKRVEKLNAFAALLCTTYSIQIFFLIAHSGIMLCVLIFQTSTLEFLSAKFIAYSGWMAGKLLELIIIGDLGTRLITTTDNLSSMYYQCNWEAIVYRSTNRRQNVMLMNQIKLAILIYQKPIELNGLGFFNVSLETAASLIRAAGSYFTFLNTFQ